MSVVHEYQIAVDVALSPCADLCIVIRDPDLVAKQKESKDARLVSPCSQEIVTALPNTSKTTVVFIGDAGFSTRLQNADSYVQARCPYNVPLVIQRRAMKLDRH